MRMRPIDFELSSSETESSSIGLKFRSVEVESCGLGLSDCLCGCLSVCLHPFRCPGSRLGSFWEPWGVPGLHFGSFGGVLGSILGSLGLYFERSGGSLGAFGCPWDPQGSPWSPRSEFGFHFGVILGAKVATILIIGGPEAPKGGAEERYGFHIMLIGFQGLSRILRTRQVESK